MQAAVQLRGETLMIGKFWRRVLISAAAGLALSAQAVT